MARRNLKDFLVDDTLDLSLNDLQDVPVKEIAQFPKATSLDLSNNKLTILSKSFATALTHLVKLDLARNELKELPKNFGCLVNLKHLDLYKNKLESLPLSFGNLKALRWLDLKENPLEPHWHQIVGPCLNAQDCKNAAKNVVNIAGIMRDEIESEVRSQSRLKQKELEEQEQKEINKKKEKQREKKKRKNAAKLAEANHFNKIENGSTVKVEPISETEEELSEAPKQSLVRNWSVKKIISGLFRVFLYSLVTIWLMLIVLKFVNEPLHKKIWTNINNRNHRLLTSLVPGHTLHSFKRAALNFFALAQEFFFKVWLTSVEFLRSSWNFIYSDPRFEIYLQSIIHGFLYLYVAFCNSVSICLTFITSNIQNITS